MATRTVTAIGGLSSLTSTYVEGVLPTNADKIVLDATSGDFTVDSTLACRSIRCDGYTGNFTHNAGIAINIGDATSADDDIALRFSAGMTYSKVHPATSAINLISTSATQQQIETNGQVLGNVIQNGAGSSYILNDDLILTPFFATLTTQAGTINTNDKTVTAMIWTQIAGGAKTITLGASVIHLYPAVSDSLSWANTSAISITANTAIVHVYRSPTNPNGSTFIRVPSTIPNYLTLHVWGGGIMTHASGGTNGIFANTYYHGAPMLNGIDDRVQMNVNVQVTGTVNILAYSTERRIRVHNGGDFVLPNASALYCEYTDFQSVNIPTYTVDLSAMPGGTGDLGGNSNIIFSPAIDCYWYQTVSGQKSWTDAANWYLATNGTGGQARKPLAQDRAIFDANSFQTTGCIVQVDSGSIRMAKDIDWTGATNNPTWDLPSLVTMYGSLTMENGVNVVAPSNGTFFMSGSTTASSYTLKNADVVWPMASFLINLVSTESCTLQDDFNGSSTTVFQINGQLIDFNNKNVTTGRIVAAGSAISFGSGTKRVTGSGTVFSCTTTTVNANTGIIEIDSQNNVAKTFAGSGKSYGTLKISGNYDDNITFTGNNTFAAIDLNFTSAKNLIYTASSNTTVTGTITKTAGSLWILRSTTATAFTWTKASGTVHFVDAIISRSTATGGATFTADTDSIDGGGNTGWTGFVTNPFTWTGADFAVNLNWDNPLNWLGGNVPTTTDLALFTGGVTVRNCTMNAGVDCKGIFIAPGYTGTITQSSNIVIGTSGIEQYSGTFTGGAFTIYNAGRFKHALGTWTNCSGVFTQIAQGSSINTWITEGGTFNANGGTVQLEGSLDAIISNASARQFFHFITSSFTGKLSGTFFADGSLTLQDQEFNGDASARLVLNIGMLTGTGIFRIVGTNLTLNADNIPNLQFNCTGTVTLSKDCIVDSTLTITSVATVNGFNMRCKGNIASADTAISGTTNTIVEGTAPEQGFSGVGVCIGDVEINKQAGLVKLTSNFQPCDIGKNFTVAKGQFNTNNYNCALINNVTVIESLGGLFYKTELTTLQISGILTGRVINRQKLYSNGIML